MGVPIAGVEVTIGLVNRRRKATTTKRVTKRGRSGRTPECYEASFPQKLCLKLAFPLSCLDFCFPHVALEHLALSIKMFNSLYS